MFTANDMRSLLNTQPFVPFRLLMSDGGVVEVRSREVVNVGRHQAVIGLLDPDARDTLFERWTVIWYLHVSRVEQIHPGSPPLASPPGPPDASTPSRA